MAIASLWLRTSRMLTQSDVTTLTPWSTWKLRDQSISVALLVYWSILVPSWCLCLQGLCLLLPQKNSFQAEWAIHTEKPHEDLWELKCSVSLSSSSLSHPRIPCRAKRQASSLVLYPFQSLSPHRASGAALSSAPSSWFLCYRFHLGLASQDCWRYARHRQ